MHLYGKQFTKLYHTLSTVETQTVGERNMSAILLVLEFHPNPSLNLLKALAINDLHKAISFDIPEMLADEIPSTATLDDKMKSSFQDMLPFDAPVLSTEEQIWVLWAIHSSIILHLQRHDVTTQEQQTLFSFSALKVANYEEQLRAFGYLSEAEETVH